MTEALAESMPALEKEVIELSLKRMRKLCLRMEQVTWAEDAVMPVCVKLNDVLNALVGSMLLLVPCID